MKTILFVVSILFVASCGSKSTSQDVSAAQSGIKDLTEHPGYSLYKMYCIACHGNEATPGNRLAPPAFMVHDRYKRAYDKEAFVERVVAWIESPSLEKSIMPGAVRNFDLMPPVPLSLEDREKIANYFYETEFAEPAWFSAPGHNGHRGKGMRDTN